MQLKLKFANVKCDWERIDVIGKVFFSASYPNSCFCRILVVQFIQIK